MQHHTPSPKVLMTSYLAGPSLIDLHHFQDLHKVREILMQRLGPDFSTKAMLNEDNRVSLRVFTLLPPFKCLV